MMTMQQANSFSRRGRNHSTPVALLAIVLLGMVGCAKQKQDFVPNPTAAEDAIRSAMEAWKESGAVGEIADTKPLVHVTDSNRKRGQTLSGYTILGEVPGSAGRTYMVELNLASPAEKLNAQYIVVGIDPLWIFRQEDYELLMHWDHHMPELSELKADQTDKP